MGGLALGRHALGGHALGGHVLVRRCVHFGGLRCGVYLVAGVVGASLLQRNASVCSLPLKTAHIGRVTCGEVGRAARGRIRRAADRHVVNVSGVGCAGTALKLLRPVSRASTPKSGGFQAVCGRVVGTTQRHAGRAVQQPLRGTAGRYLARLTDRRAG